MVKLIAMMGVLWLKTGTCYLPLLLLLLASDESDSVRPHRLQPIRLHHPWDFPGKNTRVGCHFLLQCMKVKSENEGAQSSPTLRDPMDCSLPSSSIHGIFQARVLERGAIAFSDLYCCFSHFVSAVRTPFPWLIFNKFPYSCNRIINLDSLFSSVTDLNWMIRKKCMYQQSWLSFWWMWT